MNEKFATLFETVELPNKVQLKNKFVLAPLTHVTSHDDGTVSEDEINYMEQRSQDVGLSISAASNVTDLGKAFPGQPSVAHDTDIEGLKKLANVMKKNGAKAVVQIHHGGAQSLPNWTPNGDVAAPSPISMKSFGETEEHHAREITHDEILETIKAFGEATRRVIEAGFDGVEIHGANHYLIHQFVSPYYNRRTDEWGTDKFKFAREVVDEGAKSVEEEILHHHLQDEDLGGRVRESIPDRNNGTAPVSNIPQFSINQERIYTRERSRTGRGEETRKKLTAHTTRPPYSPHSSQSKQPHSTPNTPTQSP